MMIFCSRTLGSYRFTKVRFAGRYYRAQTQSRPANRLFSAFLFKKSGSVFGQGRFFDFPPQLP